MPIEPELKLLLDIRSRETVEKHRAGIDEPSHEKGHLERVGIFAIRLGNEYGFNPHTLALAYVAGKTHDAQRSTGENPNSQDEIVSAQVANRLLLDLNRSDEFPTTYRQRRAVMYAIDNHGKAPDRFTDPKTRDLVPSSLAEKLQLLLYASDKISEANGPWIIARRPHFMATRLKDPNGTWQEFGFKPNKDEAMVTAVESAIRMSIVSVEATYPKQLKITVAPLFEVQRAFVLGLYKALHLTTDGIADILLNRFDPESGKNILDKRGYDAPRDRIDLSDFIARRSGLTAEAIAETSHDQAYSALEAVDHFAYGHKQNLERLVRNWNPEGEPAKLWHQGMIRYLDGTLYD